MRFRRPQAVEPEIQLAPLIDVILLLLLFYSVAATFTDQPRIDLQLPPAGSGVSAKGSEPLVIAVEADGRYAVNGRTLAGTDVDALKTAIAAALRQVGGDATGEKAKVPVTILGDAEAPHHAIVGAMDAARQLGIASVRIATRSADGEGQ